MATIKRSRTSLSTLWSSPGRVSSDASGDAEGEVGCLFPKPAVGTVVAHGNRYEILKKPELPFIVCR